MEVYFIMVNGLNERLHEQRKRMRLSQREVASIIDVSPSIISNYENGERVPSVESLMALANLYHCSVDYLLGFKPLNPLSLDVSMLKPEQICLLEQFLNSLTSD